MDTETLSAVVSLLVVLSIASERLVEIVKGLSTWLNEERQDPRQEGWRKAALQFLAVVAGIVTAFLGQPAIQSAGIQGWDTPTAVLGLGLLASGGSGFWNSILAYMKNVKDLNKELVKEKQKLTT
jgi:hypothetical protein